jgi:hypothetical protein
MPDPWQKLQSGQIWSSAAGTVGLGGIGNQQGLGELALEDPSVQEATLTLGIRSLNPGLAFGDGRIYAQLTFGIGAASEVALVDWTATTTISLPVGKVNVVAIQTDAFGHPAIIDLNGFAVNPLQVINVPITLTASLAAVPRSSQGMPTLTQTVRVDAGGGATILRPPQRAKRVLVGDPRGQVASDLQVTLGGSNSFNFFQLGNAADSIIRTEGVIIPGGDDVVSLTSVAGVLGVPVCWLLDG